MQYSLLLHHTGIHDHYNALTRIVDAWDDSFRIPLRFFSNKGPGENPGARFLKHRAVFGRLDQAFGFKLRASRKRGDTSLQFYFTNPDRAFYGDLNFIAAIIPDHYVKHAGFDAISTQVLRFIAAVHDVGSLIDASFEHEDILLQSPGCEVLNAVKATYDCNLGHIAFINGKLLTGHGGAAALQRAGFVVHSSFNGGCLGSLPYEPTWPTVRIAWHLFDALEALGLFRRHRDTSLLHKDFLSLKQIGGFLGAFEAHFGRVFAERYSDGLRPIMSA